MAIPLLETCSIAGRDITGDALMTQRALAAYVVKQQAHHHFTVKSNQPTLERDIALLFKTRGTPASGHRTRQGARCPTHWKGTHMNTRRQTLLALGAGTLANALPAFAQSSGKPAEKIWRVGILVQASQVSGSSTYLKEFLRGMRERGYVEGRNLQVEWRYADNQIERLPALAAELLALRPDVLVANANAAPLALQKATSTVPIVMLSPGDPVGSGLVKSLAQPGGNITGLSVMGELGPKRLEMLRDMVPKLAHVALLLPAGHPRNRTILEGLQAAAQTLGMKILPFEAATLPDIATAFAAMAKAQVRALIVSPDPLFSQNSARLAELAAKQRLPAIAADRGYTQTGLLMSYGPSYADSFHRGAYYVDRIFKGAKPADLPIEQPTRFELFINGKTATALGLKIPQSLLITAEKVIE